MRVGDLAMTKQGNLVVITEVGYNRKGKVDWYNIVFSTTGYVRTGYPAWWLRPHRGVK
jgi:hypothetical protein